MARLFRMRTLLPRMILLLLTYSVGGAIINVAVAWGCVIMATSVPKPRPLHTFNSSGMIFVRVHTGCLIIHQDGLSQSGYRRGGGRLSDSEFQDMVPHGSAFHAPDPQRPDKYYWFREHLAGWPKLSLRGAINELDVKPYTVVQHGLFRFPFQDESPGRWNQLSFLPIWPGFAFNTIFYATILWLLFAAPGFVRRHIRIKRGQCPACAYPVGPSNVCTECGRPVLR